jgi:hypothetical protein
MVDDRRQWAPLKVTPEIIENVFRTERWSLSQAIVWAGAQRHEAVAVGSESLSPWVTSGLVDEAAYVLFALAMGDLDDTTPVQYDTTPAQHDAHVHSYDVHVRVCDAHVRLQHRLLAEKTRASAKKNWARWGAKVESKLRAGLLGLTGIPAGEASNRTITSSECTDLRLVGGNLTLLPKLTRQHPAHTDSPIAIESPLISRERVLKEFPPQRDDVAPDTGSLPPRPVEGRERHGQARVLFTNGLVDRGDVRRAFPSLPTEGATNREAGLSADVWPKWPKSEPDWGTRAQRKAWRAALPSTGPLARRHRWRLSKLPPRWERRFRQSAALSVARSCAHSFKKTKSAKFANRVTAYQARRIFRASHKTERDYDKRTAEWNDTTQMKSRTCRWPTRRVKRAKPLAARARGFSKRSRTRS